MCIGKTTDNTFHRLSFYFFQFTADKNMEIYDQVYNLEKIREDRDKLIKGHLANEDFFNIMFPQPSYGMKKGCQTYCNRAFPMISVIFFAPE